jgi:hypothetical protein
MPWDVSVDDAVAAIAAARARHGDRFIVESGGDRFSRTAGAALRYRDAGSV